MFKVLPFGLSSACFCFTTLRRPLVKHLRSMSHCCFVYLDNAISGLPQRISAIVASLVQIEWLKIEQEEIEFGAYVSGQWLGFVIDTIGMQQFRVPPKKIAKLKSNLNFMIMSRTVTFRDLTRVAGFINSLLACVAWRFWLGALSNKGGRG